MNEMMFSNHVDPNDKLAIDDAIVSAWAIYTVYNKDNDFTQFSEYAFNVIMSYYNQNPGNGV